MRNDPTYEWWEYGCHEGNTIVQNYSTTNRYEREHPAPEPPGKTARVSADVAAAVTGRWVGRPRIVTIDLDIELSSTGIRTARSRGHSSERTWGRSTSHSFTMKERRMNFELPNTQPWTFAGELAADGNAIVGTLNSAQGGLPVTFRKR